MTHAQPQKKSVFNMNVDLMHGPILKSLLLFMLPILVSNLFQQLYNTVDTMIVGNVLGDTALAAIGSCGSIYELLVGFGIGIGNGLGQIELQLERGVGTLDGSECHLLVEGLAAIGDTGTPLTRAVRHAFDSRDVLLAHMIDLGLGAADAALAAQPNRYIEAAVGCLKGNLASQHAAAGNTNGLVAHWNSPLLRNSIDVYLFNRKEAARRGRVP